MGKELQMAREENEGRPMLLAISSTGKPLTTSYRRNPRQKATGPFPRPARRKAKGTQTKSKDSSNLKGADASPTRPARRGRGDKDREQGGSHEGENGIVRRSAQDLGIVFPGSYCDEAELTPHYWSEADRPYGGSLLQCKLCRRHLWLPLSFMDAYTMQKLIEKHGGTDGYCRYLNRHRPAKMLMAKMLDLRRLETEVSDKREFARLTDKILSDKEYDKVRR